MLKILNRDLWAAKFIPSQVAHSWENGDPANNAYGSVDECKEQNIAEDGAVELVVRGEGDDGPECDSDRVEHLKQRGHFINIVSPQTIFNGSTWAAAYTHTSASNIFSHTGWKK